MLRIDLDLDTALFLTLIPYSIPNLHEIHNIMASAYYRALALVLASALHGLIIPRPSQV